MINYLLSTLFFPSSSLSFIPPTPPVSVLLALLRSHLQCPHATAKTSRQKLSTPQTTLCVCVCVCVCALIFIHSRCIKHTIDSFCPLYNQRRASGRAKSKCSCSETESARVCSKKDFCSVFFVINRLTVSIVTDVVTIHSSIGHRRMQDAVRRCFTFDQHGETKVQNVTDGERRLPPDRHFLQLDRRHKVYFERSDV